MKRRGIYMTTRHPVGARCCCFSVSLSACLCEQINAHSLRIWFPRRSEVKRSSASNLLHLLPRDSSLLWSDGFLRSVWSVNKHRGEVRLITGAENTAPPEELTPALPGAVFGFGLIRKGLMLLIDNPPPTLYLILFLTSYSSPLSSFHSLMQKLRVFVGQCSVRAIREQQVGVNSIRKLFSLLLHLGWKQSVFGAMFFLPPLILAVFVCVCLQTPPNNSHPSPHFSLSGPAELTYTIIEKEINGYPPPHTHPYISIFVGT